MKNRNTLFFIFILLFFLSFFHRYFVVANYIGMCVVALFGLLDTSIREKWLRLKERKHVQFMLAFFVYLTISFLISSNKHDAGLYFTRRLPLLFFPISIGLISFTREFRDKILLGFAAIVCAGCLVSLGWAFYQYTISGNWGWLYNDPLSSFIHQQSIYTSVLVNISIYVLVYYILYYRPPALNKFFSIAGIVFLFIMSYLLASRNMMLILYSSVIAFAIYVVIKRRKIIAGTVLLAGVIAGIAMIFLFFPKTINRFKELTFTQFDFAHVGSESHFTKEVTADQWNGANFRLAAWQCGWELFKKHPLTGVGLGDKKDELLNVYKEKNFQFAISTNKNVHNNYLDILISTGMLGLLLFLLGWIILPFVRLIRNNDGLGCLILATFSLAMITENYFDRSIGCVLLAFFVPLLLTAGKQAKVKD